MEQSSQIVYHYAYGSYFLQTETASQYVPDSSITITKHNSDVYRIVYIQHSLKADFDKIKTTQRITQKVSEIEFIDIDENMTIYKNTTQMTLKVQDNPPPEKLFEIIPATLSS